jgi:hypothetical protein
MWLRPMLTKGNYQKFMKGLAAQILPFQIIPLISRIPYLLLESDRERFAAEPVAFLRSFALSFALQSAMAWQLNTLLKHARVLQPGSISIFNGVRRAPLAPHINRALALSNMHCN